MAADRRALLIASSAYTDPALTTLRAPAGDVHALAAVLEDPSIGDFEVRRVIDRPTDEVREEIEGFFNDARPDDLLLLYITGHGVLSPRRRLHLATVSTKVTRLSATAIDARFVGEAIDGSRARSTVLLLDCCHSGAYTRGFAPKSASHVDVAEQFEGRGHVVLTASGAHEYAFEMAGDETEVHEYAAARSASLFTRCLVEGLSTGDADGDRDGRVSVDELYKYVYDRVRARSPDQTPEKGGEGHGDILIARSPHRGAPPPWLRDTIDTALEHSSAVLREAAVADLGRTRGTADPAIAAAIDDALRRALDDDSRRVSAAAHEALRPPREGPTRRVSAELGDSEIAFETSAEAEESVGDVTVELDGTVLRCTAAPPKPGDGRRTIHHLPPTPVHEALSPRLWRYSFELIAEATWSHVPDDASSDVDLEVVPVSIAGVHSYVVLAINGLSAAMLCSGISRGPVAAVRIGIREQDFVIDPRTEPASPAELDLIVAGTNAHDLMVEPTPGQQVKEPEFMDAVDIAYGELRKLWVIQCELARTQLPPEPTGDGDAYERVRRIYRKIQAAEPRGIPFVRA